MPLPEYDDQDATGLAAWVRDGEVSSTELLDAAIARIEARNGQLNAVVERTFDYARERLERLPDEGPLRGVPFLLKDLKLQLRGTPTTNSTKLMARHVASETSELARRYERAGLVVVGKTNTSEMGLVGYTNPDLRGPCRNPWDLGLTPGGSSGGSASAVAARIVPAAHGGDVGGSIRIPAAHCGLFGLKPTRGRVTMAPFYGEAMCGFGQEHVLTRSVRDSALLLDIADAPTLGEPYVAPQKERPWLEEVGADPGQLRIAFSGEPLFADGTHPQCRAAVERAVGLLEELGHTVVEDRPRFPREDLVHAYFVVIASGVAAFVDAVATQAAVKPRPADFETPTWAMALIGWNTPASELVAAQSVIHRASRVIAPFFQQYDAFLLPTTAQLPVGIGTLKPPLLQQIGVTALTAMPLRAILDRILAVLGSKNLAPTPNTQLFNQTGQPAMTVPLHWTPEGVPVGAQFAARFGGEAVLLRLASQLEQAAPWAHKRPRMLG
ncbi:MAG: amidase [Alphaproteobacteria bacterium]|nr:amidase [Alphaproteobacteria bacterium]